MQINQQRIDPNSSQLREIVIHNPKPNLKIRIPVEPVIDDGKKKDLNPFKIDRCLDHFSSSLKVAIFAASFFYAYERPDSLIFSLPISGLVYYCF